MIDFGFVLYVCTGETFEATGDPNHGAIPSISVLPTELLSPISSDEDLWSGEFFGGRVGFPFPDCVFMCCILLFCVIPFVDSSWVKVRSSFKESVCVFRG